MSNVHKRGFASLSPERRTELARMGAAVKPENRSFSKSQTLAQSAGSKGGQTSRGGGKKKPAV